MAQAIRTPPTECTAEDCDQRANAYGLCNSHYKFAVSRGLLLPVVRTFAEAYWQRIERQPNGCWHWTGELQGGLGYGIFNKTLAHRAVYELLVGPIPEGLDLDHQCHNRDAECPGGPACLHRRCVNPSHLDPTSRGENVRRAALRKTHCKSGHPWNEANTGWHHGRRSCRACARNRMRQRDGWKGGVCD